MSEPGRVLAADRWLARKFLAALGNPRLAIVFWSGEEVRTCADRPVARAVVRDRGALYRMLTNPVLHFGDLYSVERIDIEGDLVQFLEATYRGFDNPGHLQLIKKLQNNVLNRPRANNTLTDSRTNIQHHYDLGNEFYELWLDTEAMQYTCAYFPNPAMTIEQAQIAKLDHVCRKLQLKPGDRVVEAGCGWGGLARHMARHYGVTVRAYNISQQQILYAREKAKQQGLADRIEYVEDDYRNIAGEYDAFVSIGMLEHVGPDHYRALADVIQRALTPTSRGLIHTIGRNRPARMNAWIEKRIFPGGHPPTLGEMMPIFETHNFSVLDVENLRLHYAKTLEHWLARFDRNVGKIEEMYDHNFVRAWRLYLAGSIAAFNTGSLQLFQVVFARGTDNKLPWSREHLYKK
ncbi:MAG: cyclopropane-fatty-acyl-phospholipid synthase family protein [Pseudomonadota bacterium]